MLQCKQTYQKGKWREYSSLFSRTAFNALLKYGCKDQFSQVFSCYDSSLHEYQDIESYLNHVYRSISAHYRCEYVYKNELINSLLLKTYGTERTVAFNEFRVKDSIADMAMFNGESKAFEIKTELDTKKRLSGQICDYTRLFQKCYVVVPEEKVESFANSTGYNIGIIALKYVKRHIELYEYRGAVSNRHIDAGLVMRCLRTGEYKHLICTYFDKLPNVSAFQMYDACLTDIKRIPDTDLQQLFLREMENRKTCTPYLKKVPSIIRQMCLSLNLAQESASLLTKKLKEPLI